MKRYLAFGVLGLFAFGSAAACGSGSQGPQGPQGEPGEAGPPGPPGEGLDAAGTTPSISAVIPNRTFLARNTEVTVSGYATNWSATSKPTVDFGPNIKVTNIIVASPTSLVVDITTDKAATTGLRDVKVTDSSGTQTYAKAFNVFVPIAVDIQGLTAQGGILLVTIHNLDVANPFDATTATDAAGNTIYPNLAITFPKGVTNQAFETFSGGAFAAAAPSATEIPMLVTLDVNAPAAKGDIDVLSGPAGTDGGVGPGAVDFPMPAGFDVQARMATALTSGTAAMATIANAGDTALFSFTPASNSMTVLDWTGTATSSGAQIVLLSGPTWGAGFANVISDAITATVLTTSTQPVYGTWWDPSGAKGSISVTSTATAAGGNAAASASDGTKATAVAATALPFVLTSGDLSTGGDWVKVTLPAGQTKLRVQTIGDPNTDTLVTLFASDGTTQVGTAETATLVDNTFTGLTAGATYYVTFTQGGQSFLSTTDYSAIIR
jgi:hypothetical protein